MARVSLQQGLLDSIDVTLTFEGAGDITVPLSIQAFNARAAGDAPQGADPHAWH